MFFRKDPATLLREVNPRVLDLVRNRSYYEAIKLGTETLRKVGDIGKDSWELQRLLGVSFYYVYKEKIRAASIAQTGHVIAHAEEGDIAISNLEYVRRQEAAAGFVNSATCFWLAMVYMDRQDYAKTRNLLDSIAAQPPLHVDYYVMLGRLAEMDGNLAEKKNHLKAAHQIDPRHWWVQLELAELLREQEL